MTKYLWLKIWRTWVFNFTLTHTMLTLLFLVCTGCPLTVTRTWWQCPTWGGSSAPHWWGHRRRRWPPWWTLSFKILSWRLSLKTTIRYTYTSTHILYINIHTSSWHILCIIARFLARPRICQCRSLRLHPLVLLLGGTRPFVCRLERERPVSTLLLCVWQTMTVSLSAACCTTFHIFCLLFRFRLYIMENRKC